MRRRILTDTTQFQNGKPSVLGICGLGATFGIKRVWDWVRYCRNVPPRISTKPNYWGEQYAARTHYGITPRLTQILGVKAAAKARAEANLRRKKEAPPNVG
jgi:hypothetical protein